MQATELVQPQPPAIAPHDLEKGSSPPLVLCSHAAIPRATATATQRLLALAASSQSPLRSQFLASTTSEPSAQALPSWPQPQPSLPVQLTPAALLQLTPSLSPGTATVWPSLVLPMPPGSDTSSLLSGSRSLTRSGSKSSCAIRTRFLSEKRPSSGDSGCPKIGCCFVNSNNDNNDNNCSNNNNNSCSNSSNNNGNNKSNSNGKSMNSITFCTSDTQQNAVRRGRSEAPQSAIAPRSAPFGTAAAPPPRPPRAYGHPLTAAAAAEVTWRGRRKDPSSHDAQSPSTVQAQVATAAPYSPGGSPPADPKFAHEDGQNLSSHLGSGPGRGHPKSPSAAIFSPPSSSAPLQAITAPLTSDDGALGVSAAPATTPALVTSTAAALGGNSGTAFNAIAPAIAPPTAALSTCSSASPAAATTTIATVTISSVCRTSSLGAVLTAPMLAPFRGCKCWQAGICTNAPCSIDYLCETRIAIRRVGLFHDAPEPHETLHLGQRALCPSSPPLADPSQVENTGAMPPPPSNGAPGFLCRFWEAGLYGSTPCSRQQVCDTRIGMQEAGLRFVQPPSALALQVAEADVSGITGAYVAPSQRARTRSTAPDAQTAGCRDESFITQALRFRGSCAVEGVQHLLLPSSVASTEPRDNQLFQKQHHYQLQLRAEPPSESSLLSGTTAAGDAAFSTVSTSTTSTSATTFATTATDTSITLSSEGESRDDFRDSVLVLSSTGERRNEKTMTSEEVGANKMPLPVVPEVWFRTAALICAKDRAAASSPQLAVGSLATARRSPSMPASRSEYRLSTGTATNTTRRLLDAELGRVTSQHVPPLPPQQPSNKPGLNGCKATTAVSGRWRTGECTEIHVNDRRGFNLGNGHRQVPIVWGVERGKVTGSMCGGSQLSLSSKGCKSQQAILDKTRSSRLNAEPLRLPLVGSAQRFVAPAMGSAHAAHAVLVVMLVAGVNERRSGVPKEALEEANAAAVMVAAAASAGDPGQMAGAEVGRAVPTLHQVRTYVSLSQALPDLRRSVGNAGGLCGAVTADSTDIWWVQYNAAFVPTDE